MAMPVIGTIHNAGKLAAEKRRLKSRYRSPDQTILRRFEKMEEGKKLSDIMVKLKSGGTLTSDELDYLKKKNPQVYQDAIAIERERESYQRQLKNCKSKEEAEKLKINKMNGALAEAKSIVNNPRIPEDVSLEEPETKEPSAAASAYKKLKKICDNYYTVEERNLNYEYV